MQPVLHAMMDIGRRFVEVESDRDQLRREVAGGKGNFGFPLLLSGDHAKLRLTRTLLL